MLTGILRVYRKTLPCCADGTRAHAVVLAQIARFEGELMAAEARDALERNDAAAAAASLSALRARRGRGGVPRAGRASAAHRARRGAVGVPCAAIHSTMALSADARPAPGAEGGGALLETKARHEGPMIRGFFSDERHRVDRVRPQQFEPAAGAYRM